VGREDGVWPEVCARDTPPPAFSAMTDSTVRVRAPQSPRNNTPLSVTSTSIREGELIAMQHVFTGCGGKNVSPQLAWRDAPAGTQSFAISCFDPDAPTGSGYWHWVVFNIPGSTTRVDAGAGESDSPSGGRTGYNDFGINKYAGPCPPKGDEAHRYIFTVYALDVSKLEGASEKTTGATMNFLMRGHVLATGTITGRFGH
jgi:Raf kinase inhibitor-like YbhB/YbcL family protein